MSDVSDVEKVGVTFIWKIQNYSFGWHTHDVFTSPAFKVDVRNNITCKLRLHSRGQHDGKNGIVCSFLQYTCNDGHSRYANWEISFLDSNGSSLESICTRYQMSNGDEVNTICILFDEIFVLRRIAFLPEDTLTIRCCVTKYDNVCLPFSKCSALTRIGIERASFLWTLQNFSTLQTNEEKVILVESPSAQYSPLNLKLFLAGDSKIDERLQFEVHQSRGEQDSLSTLKISLLNAETKSVATVGDRYLFKKSENEQVWRFPPLIKKNQLTGAKNQLLPKDVLSLWCEFANSFGIVLNQIEATRSGRSYIQGVDCGRNESDGMLSEDPEELLENSSNSLNEEMRCLLEEGSFSDIYLRVGNRLFSAHKAILGARSPVFKAMFTQDREEKANTFDIPDLEEETVTEMLLYLYTDTLKDFRWDSMKKLYFAADKYGILCLKQKCSSFFKSLMCPAKACQILLLADMHQDEDLKEAVQEFIRRNDTEILHSDEWRNLEKNNARLTTNALLYMYIRNRVHCE